MVSIIQCDNNIKIFPPSLKEMMPRLLIIIGGKKWIKLPQIPNPATQVEHYQSILHSSACHLCRPLTQWRWQGDVSVKCRSGCESARPRPEHFPSLTFQKHGVCVLVVRATGGLGHRVFVDIQHRSLVLWWLVIQGSLAWSLLCHQREQVWSRK